MARPELRGTPLLPDGFEVPVSRGTHPATRFRRLLDAEPYLFGPGIYDPMGAQLVMYHGVKAVYFSGYSLRSAISARPTWTSTAARRSLTGPAGRSARSGSSS